MKKLPLALMTILTLCISAYFLSCKKETQSALLLPAIQMIREAATKDWEPGEKTLLQLPITFSEKLKPEFANFETDSSIVVSCRVKFKGQDQEVLLPYSVPYLGGVKYYFYTLSGGKPKILFHNTNVCDVLAAGGGSALPLEQVSFSFSKIDY